MWRIKIMIPFLLVVLLVALPALGEDNDDIPVFRIVGDEPAVVDPVDDDDVDDEADDPTEPVELVSGHVEWEFFPVIEVTSTTGAITDADAQRTLNADQDDISACFSPTSYPGEGTVTVDVHLSYNGVPTSVNGSTDGVIQPAQARCVLQRAWRYEFPRMADDADQGSRVQYRVQFVGQQIDPPSVTTDQARHLLERVRTDDADLHDQVVTGLRAQLDTAERCAATVLEELPGDFIATEVHMRWQHADNGYRPSAVDITVDNKTSSHLPSRKVLDCYRHSLTGWTIDIDGDELPSRLAATFFITIAPPASQRL